MGPRDIDTATESAESNGVVRNMRSSPVLDGPPVSSAETMLRLVW